MNSRKSNYFLNDLKEFMYTTTNYNTFCKLNEILYQYDMYRALTIEEEYNAGKEWKYRTNKILKLVSEGKRTYSIGGIND